MAVMVVDLPQSQVPALDVPRRWVHVGSPRPGQTRPATVPSARPSGPSRPGGRPRGVAAPSTARVRVAVPAAAQGCSTATPSAAAAGPLRLTQRGLAVVMGGFALVMLTAVVVLITSFLAIPNEPLVASLPLG